MSEILEIKKRLLAGEPLVEQATYRDGTSGDHSFFRGSGFEGAERRHRETVAWQPSMASPDQNINTAKALADARSRDMSQNDGYTSGAVNIHKDSIVGAHFRLNAKPDWRTIGAPEGWAEEFQVAVESRFNLIGESEANWFDAQRRNTFTSLIRLGVGGFVLTGEVLGTAEWIKDSRRPCSTAIQMTSPDRLTNPNGQCDTRNLRRGVNRDDYGRALSYFFRMGYPTDIYNDSNAYTWKEVPAETKWGRKQVIHIVEQRLPDQTRGIAEMVSALKQMRMTKQFQEITLQNAVINASYAAAIESELPPDAVYQMMGGPGTGQPGDFPWLGQIGAYMEKLSAYMASAGNIKIDGAKIPHLFPGTKLAMKPMGTPGGMGTGFEESLLRYIAASLGLSYEEFSRDFSKTNYSSARAATAQTGRFMASRKKLVADGTANSIYSLYLEEDIANGNLPMPPGFKRSDFYKPLMKEAFTLCSWIGANRGQIDELKETEAAILRIKSGLSSYEIECSRLGSDFRDLFAQVAREQKLQKTLSISFNLDANPKSILSGSDPIEDDAAAAQQPATGAAQHAA